MKIPRTGFGLLFFATALVHSTYPAYNFISNGGFESPWIKGTPAAFIAVGEESAAVLRCTDREEGGKCVTVVPLEGKDAVVRQEIALELDPGKEYILTAEIKAADLEGTAKVCVINGGWAREFGILSPPAGSSDWQQRTSQPFKVEKTNGKYYLVIYLKSGSKGTFSVDNIRLELADGSDPQPVVIVTKTIQKTAVAPAAVNKKHPQFKEMPYVETAPEPLLNDKEKSRGFLIFSRAITEIIYPNTRPLAQERIESLTAFATPGEFEPFNFAFYPVKDFKNVKVSVTKLISANGKEIHSECVDVRVLRYYDIRYPHYTSSSTFRRVPELLEKCVENTFTKGECQRYWLTVKVPADARADLYSGTAVISGEGFSPVSIPLNLRVLGFALKNDPARHFGAYSYPFAEKRPVLYDTLPAEITTNEARIFDVAVNECRVMRDYGIDTPLEFGLIRYDAALEKLYLAPDKQLEILKKAGLLPAPFIIAGTGNVTSPLLKKFKIINNGHYVLDRLPPPEFYVYYAELIKKLEIERKANGWPVFVYYLADELAANTADFGVTLYKTIKALGVPTITSKDPKAPDAALYAPYLDYWIAQTYSVPYEEVIRNKQFHYWTYPNHNASEVRIPEVMCLGGRMTYGYGFWRSGYEGIAPWHWRWSINSNSDFLDGQMSGCGNQIARDGSVTPAVYWECFREGYDDQRYLYTLEAALAARKNTKDGACLEALAAGKALIQRTWDAVEPQLKYLQNDMWYSDDFNSRRWEIALAIEALHCFPGSAPADIPVKRTARREATVSVFEKSRAEDNLEIFDLGSDNYALWKSETGEGATEAVTDRPLEGNSCLKWTVNIDYSSDEGDKGYPVGWPRIAASFTRGSMDLTKYDYLSLWYYIESDRDEVADDFTPVSLTLFSHASGKSLGEKKNMIGAAEQRQWCRLLIPVKDLLNSFAEGDLNAWKDIQSVKFFMREADYKDRTKLVLFFKELQLIKFKSPRIAGMLAPTMALLPCVNLVLSCSLVGDSDFTPGEYLILAQISDGKNILAQTTCDPAECRKFGTDTSGITVAGTYTLTMTLLDKKKAKISQSSQPIRFLDGPLRYSAR